MFRQSELAAFPDYRLSICLCYCLSHGILGTRANTLSRSWASCWPGLADLRARLTDPNAFPRGAPFVWLRLVIIAVLASRSDSSTPVVLPVPPVGLLPEGLLLDLSESVPAPVTLQMQFNVETKYEHLPLGQYCL